MDQLRTFADDRLCVGCIYCGGPEETQEHVPSRAFLDKPFPGNLPVVPACFDCNNGFSRDEEYLVCLIESVLAGTTEPDRLGRCGVADMLRRSPALRSRIHSALREENGRTLFDIDEGRVRNVIVKLAQGHAVYELSRPQREAPTSVLCRPLCLMTSEERDAFDASHGVATFGEIGSRNMQRLFVAQCCVQSPSGEELAGGFVVNDWIEVQDARYRFLPIDAGDEVRVKIVLREYLACEVVWTG